MGEGWGAATQGRRVNLLPDLGAKGDGGVFEGGIEVCFQALGGGRRDGLDHGGFSGCGLFLTAFFIVRRRRVIICKRVTRGYGPFDSGPYGVYRGFWGERRERWLRFVLSHPVHWLVQGGPTYRDQGERAKSDHHT